MIVWLQQAILRSAALLVPDRERVEWLAEWRSELWHARQALGTARATAFCLGAFQDGLWLRGNAPRRPMREIVNLNSPARCLGFLIVVAAASLLIAYQIPNPPPIPARPSDHLFLLIVLFACVILPTSTSLSLGDYRANRRVPSCSTRLRRWVFLAVKIALILLMTYAPMRYVAYALSADPHSGSAGLLLQVVVWGLPFAIRWSLRDQGQRCPVCLQAWAIPSASGSRPDISWNGTARN